MVNNLNNNNANRRRRRDVRNNDGQPPAQRQRITRSMTRATEMNRRADVADQMLLYHSEHLQSFRRELKQKRERVIYQYPQVKEVFSRTENQLLNQQQHFDTRGALFEAKRQVKAQYPQVMNDIHQAKHRVYEQYPHVENEIYQNTAQIMMQNPQFLEDLLQARHQMPEQNPVDC